MNPERAREWTRSLYGRLLPEGRDGYLAYIHLLDELCPDGGRVVDLGCGEEDYLSFLLPRAEVVGVDRKAGRGRYHAYLQADLEDGLPLERESVDLAACKFVLEHLRHPERLLRTVREVLRPGGCLVVMTPNVLYYPYALNLLLSRLLPQRLRMGLVSRITGRGREDIFPVWYPCNTPRRLRSLLEGCGFRVLHLEAYPDYLVSAVCRPAGAAAVFYEWFVSRLGIDWAGGFLVAAARRE
ncbi:class I SAM-dependent methyltransferase [Candidatus Solincola tengchongensis]|uniref:class I SAM-dependent methyltransferase n=1 Tax=Candidatus Solincola tengchongensis TaxID=2900693 RepID=UPI002580A90B